MRFAYRIAASVLVIGLCFFDVPTSLALESPLWVTVVHVPLPLNEERRQASFLTVAHVRTVIHSGVEETVGLPALPDEQVYLETMVDRVEVGAVRHLAGKKLMLVSLPKTWKIRQGQFAGTTLSTMGLVDSRGPTLLNPTRLFLADYPVSVGLGDTTFCSGVLANALSAAVEEISVAVGRPVFSFDGCDDRRHDTGGRLITVYADTLPLPGVEGRSSARADCAETIDAMPDCAVRHLVGGTVHLSPQATPAVAAHELLHVLGLEHTCVYPSVMATRFAQAELIACGVLRARMGLTTGFVTERRLSAADVAAIELVIDLATLAMSEAPWGMLVIVPSSGSRR